MIKLVNRAKHYRCVGTYCFFRFLFPTVIIFQTWPSMEAPKTAWWIFV
uniref:Uncharacterized protein n=1 Tax=Anguilla anguilla TaxID=7936 RepID=A0A0E9QUV0_ANGAN